MRDCSVEISLKLNCWNIFSIPHFSINISLFLQDRWVVNLPTPSLFCHMSTLGGDGWVLKEIWSMSLNNPFFYVFPKQAYGLFVFGKRPQPHTSHLFPSYQIMKLPTWAIPPPPAICVCALLSPPEPQLPRAGGIL